ncbi:MAG: glycosyltransferase family 2 protein [Candidatus Nanohaloarchaea archaeon]
MTASTATSLQVVIPCMNPLEEVRETLRTFSGQELPGTEVHLLSPPSRREEVGEIADEFLDVDYRIVEKFRSESLPGMMNDAARPGDFDYLLFLDDDILFRDSQTVQTLLAAAERPEIGAVGPVSVVHETGEVNSAGFLTGGFEFLNLDGGDDPGKLSGLREVDVLEGLAILVDSDAFLEAGGYPEDYFFYVDDFELCRRIEQAGWKNVCLMETQIRHRLGDSGEGARKSYYAVRNGSYFRKRQYSLPLYVLNRLLNLTCFYPWTLANLAIQRKPELMKAVLLGVLDSLRGRKGRQDWF